MSESKHSNDDTSPAVTPRAHAISPGLHVIATPIGNARDLTLRAIDTLNAAHVIACEDTRTSGNLLGLYAIETPTMAYHDHNGPQVRPKIIERLKNGEIVALISDAGTPLISDPGYKLVAKCRDLDLPVHVVPGASSVMAALSVAGLPTDRFLFLGFLPVKSTARRKALAEFIQLKATLVILESPKRLPAALADMAHVLGNREAAVARELTKKFEEVRRCPLPELAAHYGEAGSPKGEIVVVIGPPDARELEIDGDTLDAMIRTALAQGTVKDAVAAVTEATGLPRRRVYGRALELNRDPPADG